ncbi:MAG: MCE family protein [Alphaproteobacteria bacterium]|nr:MCE family protein [Alphaproteobacteria bacterium]MBV9062605.1 MCE family protein [Alphaproteobacteria bacterium]
METKANYVAVGVFIMALVLGLVVALLWLTGAQYAQEYAYYQTFFSGSVSGLGPGTSVRYNGIEVGRVAKLNFDSNDPRRVQVLMQIDPTLRIHADSVASIASQGLTGGSYVEIDGGSKKAPVLTPQFWGEYPTIKSKPSTLQQLEQSAPVLVAKLNKIADRLNDVLKDTNRSAIADILGNLRTTTGTLAARSADIDATLRNFNGASAGLKTDLADLHTTLGHADQAIGSINTAVLGIGRLAEHVDASIASAQIGQLSADISNLIGNLNHLSNQLEREPTRLLFGDRREGYTPK